MLSQDDTQRTTREWAPHLPPFDPEVSYSDHSGRHRARLEKRQRAMLEKVSPYIGPFLERDEKIWLITTACSPFGLLESMTTGFIITYLKRALLVFTDRRILHIPTRMNYGYRGSIAQIAYTDCASLRLRGQRLLVRYKDGKKEKFSAIARGERRKIKSLIERIPVDASPVENPGRTHLCPSCTAPLQSESYTCPSCHFAFKEPSEAQRLSILFPGGGYFYTGHPWLGALDAVVEVLFLLVAILAFWDWTHGVEGAGIDALLFGALFVIEKLVTILHAHYFVREYIPKEMRLPALEMMGSRSVA